MRPWTATAAAPLASAVFWYSVCSFSSSFFAACRLARSGAPWACFAGVGTESDLGELVEAEKNAATGDYRKTRPLFRSKAEYEEFAARHKAASEGIAELTEPKKTMYLGIDAGSTTVKAVLCDENGNVFRPFYCPNHGDPVGLIRASI